VWAEDEARLGLKPITRRVWALKGRRPRSSGRTRYDWLYVYAFARPKTGQTFSAILPRVNTGRMADALAAFAAHADPGGAKVLVVLLDNAGWHVARRLAVPPNVVLHFLPPCTPELQPAEPLWPLVREAVADRTIGSGSCSGLGWPTWPRTRGSSGGSSASTGPGGWNGSESARFGITPDSLNDLEFATDRSLNASCSSARSASFSGMGT